MTGIRGRLVLSGIILLGVLALGSQVNRIWPRENRIILRLPESPVRRVKFDLVDENEEILRTVEIFPSTEQSRQLNYVVNVPVGSYRLDIDYEFRPAPNDNKIHGVAFTRLGVRHQIRLEGEEYRFPPPEETR